ncbi:hypothetical protein NLG97_g7123 [Lecanicillium saksenae]|uniref:Uncharacterized protein n=1 Tax=Lecanicillium saksenae TaxID=468837 RepID=A0ACC1QN91_9HYPO|nr:hypothetical protein NLG97_g7123 [Lecanicillium saksenae]
MALLPCRTRTDVGPGLLAHWSRIERKNILAICFLNYALDHLNFFPHTTTRAQNTTSQSTSSSASTSTPVSLSTSVSTGYNTTTPTITTPTTTTAGENATDSITSNTGNPSPPPNLPPGYMVTRLPCNATKTPSRVHGKTKSKPKCKGGSMISIVPICTPLPSSKTFTQYSVVHTATVTFMGNRSDYTPPYAPLATPNYCNPNVFPAVPRPPETSYNGFMDPEPMTTETFTVEGQALTAEFPLLKVTPVQHVPVTTFITTDKNPSVVFPSDPIPNYSQTWPVGGGPGNGYHTPVGDGGAPPPASAVPTFTITAGPTSVIINSQTFTVAPGSRSTVTVDGGGVFTIEPSAVVGQGASITRPPSAMGPSSSVLDGIPVTSAGPNLEIGGGVFAIPMTGPNTVHVNGKAVTINPTGVTIGGDSMGFLKPAPSDILVAGGEMLTAIGRSVVVIHSVTYTYGSGIAPVVQVINGDTIAIEPTGVLVHGSTLGGVSLPPWSS